MFLAKFCCKFLALFCFFAQKTLKMTILTSVWSAHHPNAGRNIQHLCFSLIIIKSIINITSMVLLLLILMINCIENWDVAHSVLLYHNFHRSQVMVLGGFSSIINDYRPLAWFYDFSTSQWTTESSMTIGEHRHNYKS